MTADVHLDWLGAGWIESAIDCFYPDVCGQFFWGGFLQLNQNFSDSQVFVFSPTPIFKIIEMFKTDIFTDPRRNEKLFPANQNLILRQKQS